MGPRVGRWALAAQLAAVLLCLAPAASAQVLTINRAWHWPISSSDERGLFDRLIREAMGRVGVEVALQSVAAERSLRNVDLGLDDGDGPRIAGLEALYPHLIRVPQELVVYDFVAFAIDPAVSLRAVDPGGSDPWAGLAGHDVGIVRGWKILEQNIRGARTLTRVRTPELLLLLLAKGRVDVVVFERHMGLHLAHDVGLDGVHVLSPALATRPMYLYLNVRHAALVPRVAAALRAMKEDGTTARIVAEVMAASHEHGEVGP